MTRKLYYEDAYRDSFKARILEQFHDGDYWRVVLDQTCFYPGGGGQPSDKGWLNNIPVVEVKEKDGKVYHSLEEQLSDEEIKGKIDFTYRHDYMQQHTGQHIISASLLKTGNNPTVSVHLGESYTTVELDVPSISEAGILAAEELANDIIRRNLVVRIHQVNPDEMGRFPIRKPPPPAEKIRVVEIDGFDYSACGGTHVTRTGEVKLIKFTGIEKIRQRVRLHWQIGDRAFRDYHKKTRILARIMQELTCGMDDISNTINRFCERTKTLNRRIYSLEEKLGTYIAEELYQHAHVFNGQRFVFHKFSEPNRNFVKQIAEILKQKPNTVIFILNLFDSQLHWFLAQADNTITKLSEIVQPFLPLIDGQGGGRNNFLQGGGHTTRNLEIFQESVKDRILKELLHE